jgi:hypothetical protein
VVVVRFSEEDKATIWGIAAPRAGRSDRIETTVLAASKE